MRVTNASVWSSFIEIMTHSDLEVMSDFIIKTVNVTENSRAWRVFMGIKHSVFNKCLSEEVIYSGYFRTIKIVCIMALFFIYLFRTFLRISLL